MNRSVFSVARTWAVLGAVLLALTVSGCGTMVHPMSADASAGVIPPGRGAL